MSPEETKQFATNLYDATIKVTGGTWKVDGDTWNGCAQGHVQYSLDSYTLGFSQPDGTELLALTKRVQAAWATLGVHGQVVTDKNVNPVAYIVSYPDYLTGTDARQAGYTFYAQSDRLLVTFYAPCVPGDLDKVDPIAG